MPVLAISRGTHYTVFANSTTLYGCNDYGIKTMKVDANGVTVQNGTISRRGILSPQT